MGLLEGEESEISNKGRLEKAQRKRSKESFDVSASSGGRSAKKMKRSLSSPQSHKLIKLHDHAGLHSIVNKRHPIIDNKRRKLAGERKKKLLQGLALNKLTQSSSESVNAVASLSDEPKKEKKKKKLLKSWKVTDLTNSQNPSVNTEVEKQAKKKKKKSKLFAKSAVAKPTIHPGDSQSFPTNSKKKRRRKKKVFEKTDDSGMQGTKGAKSFSQKEKDVSNQTKMQQQLENTKSALGIDKVSKKKKSAQQKQATSGNLKPADNKNAQKTTRLQAGENLGKKDVQTGTNLEKTGVQVGKKNGKKGAKPSEPEPLKGKALKKRLASVIKTISRLQDQRKINAVLLLKTKNPEKINKLEERFRKINQKISKFEGELEALKNAKGNTSIATSNPSSENLLETTSQVNKRAPTREFVTLPIEQTKPKRKENKNVNLKDYLENQLKSSRFRWLNENLYSSSSEQAKEYFKEDPESFKAYHQGYAEQVAKWPVNPLDNIIKKLKSLPKGTVVADLGCGEAKLAASLPHLTVHSLDLVALKPEVIACDMAHCPLLRSSVDIAVFCLSLMGTNVGDFLLEANRILKTSGALEIAEVESRFEDIDDFIKNVEKFGFDFQRKILSDMFFFLTFSKRQDVNKSGKLPEFNLKPCLYKKR